jgi:signal transduction histidine kinase
MKFVCARSCKPIGNAYKFTDSGRMLLNKAENRHEVENSLFIDLAVSVIDTGIGISSEYQQTILRHLSSRKTRIAGSMVERFRIGDYKTDCLNMDGTISLVSKPAEGSTFNVFIPNVRTGVYKPLEESTHK